MHPCIIPGTEYLPMPWLRHKPLPIYSGGQNLFPKIHLRLPGIPCPLLVYCISLYASESDAESGNNPVGYFSGPPVADYLHPLFQGSGGNVPECGCRCLEKQMLPIPFSDPGGNDCLLYMCKRTG